MLRLAFGQGLWGGRLPDDWQVIDAEMYAVLAYLRKMATAEDAADRRCLVLSDCKPALQPRTLTPPSSGDSLVQSSSDSQRYT